MLEIESLKKNYFVICEKNGSGDYLANGSLGLEKKRKKNIAFELFQLCNRIYSQMFLEVTDWTFNASLALLIIHEFRGGGVE